MLKSFCMIVAMKLKDKITLVLKKGTGASKKLSENKSKNQSKVFTMNNSE